MSRPIQQCTWMESSCKNATLSRLNVVSIHTTDDKSFNSVLLFSYFPFEPPLFAQIVLTKERVNSHN